MLVAGLIALLGAVKKARWTFVAVTDVPITWPALLMPFASLVPPPSVLRSRMLYSGTTARAVSAPLIPNVTAATARSNFFRFTNCISQPYLSMHIPRVRVILLPRIRPACPVPFALLLPLRMPVAEDDVPAFDSVILKLRALGGSTVVIPCQRRFLGAHPARGVLRAPP